MCSEPTVIRVEIVVLLSSSLKFKLHKNDNKPCGFSEEIDEEGRH